MSKAVRGGELRSLTSLRGLAAIAVVLQHFSATAQVWCRVTIPSLVPHGYVAVDFFFVLSGFIMAYTYQEKFDQGGLRAYASFLVNRVARILPLNFFALSLIVAVGLLCQSIFGQAIVYNSTNLPLDFLINLLLLHGIGVGTNLNGPSWSISVEFLAYILFPFFLKLLYGHTWLRLVSLTIAVAALSALAMRTPRLLMTFEGPPWSLLRCFAEFMLGVGALRLLQQPRVVIILCQDEITFALSGAAGLSLLLQRDLPAVLLFPLIIVAFATNKSRAARIVQMPLLYFLGEISFSLYLLHNLFRPLELLLFQNLTRQPVGAVAALSFAALGTISVIPVAWVSYLAVERPGRAVLRNIFGGIRMNVPPKTAAPP